MSQHLHDSPSDPGGCAICGASSTYRAEIRGRDLVRGAADEYTVVSCSGCGVGRTLPLLHDLDLHAYYSTDYGVHSIPAGGLPRAAWTLRQRLRWKLALRSAPFERIASGSPGASLDVGCGRGDLGDSLIRRGWEAAGVDPSQTAVDVAGGRGVDARVGTIHSADFSSERFDVVTMLHSLEHVTDPVGDLRAAREVARPGGNLIVVVPNYGSWQRRRFGSRWFHLDLPRHRTHFTADSLRLACEAAGWTDVVVREGFDPGALLGSLQYRAFGRLVLANGWKLWTWQLISVVSVPIAWGLNRLAGRGDLLYATAQRPTAP